MITGVAIKHMDGRIFSLPSPFRHHHVISMMVKICDLRPPITGEQGFLTHDGRFVPRTTALFIALTAGQVGATGSTELFSEDLW